MISRYSKAGNKVPASNMVRLITLLLWYFPRVITLFWIDVFEAKLLNTAIELVSRPIVLTENYPLPRWDTFWHLINEGVQNLNNAAIGANWKDLFDAWAPDGEFVPLSLPYGMPKTVFLYHHNFSAACSSVGSVKIITQNIDVRKCRDHSKKEHVSLQPFLWLRNFVWREGKWWWSNRTLWLLQNAFKSVP